jgi:ERO1-like protein alpha
MCREERALNKMISGLHASISTQLSEYYIDLVKNRTYANYPLFFEQVGNHPDRLKNLFFLYSVLLRALNLAQPAIEQY